MALGCTIKDPGRISSSGDWMVMVLVTEERNIRGKYFVFLYTYMVVVVADSIA